MYLTLLHHYLRSLIRTIHVDANLIIKILGTVSLLYLLLAVFYLGLRFDDILNEFSPGTNPIDFLNSKLLYVFSVDFILRLFFQKTQNINFIPYLTLPIRRTKLISYFLTITLFNFFNLYFLIFIIPFSIINILSILGIIPLVTYLLTIILILVFLSYLILLIRNLVSFSFSLFPALAVGILLILKLLFKVQIFEEFSKVFNDITQRNFIFLYILSGSILILITLNGSLLKKHFYKVYDGANNIFGNNSNLSKILVKRISSSYILLEILLILRNKKLKGVLIVGFYIICLATYLILKKQFDFNIMFVLYVFLSGSFGYNYAQNMFSWESSYFDFISTVNFDFKRYIKSKYIVFLLSSFLTLFLVSPFLLQNKMDIFSLVTAIFYNFGIGYFVIFYVATFNSARIQLNNTYFFSWTNFNGIHLIALGLILLVPYLILLLLQSLFNEATRLLIINTLSLCCFLNYNYWFKIILRNISFRKHTNLEGYRK